MLFHHGTSKLQTNIVPCNVFRTSKWDERSATANYIHDTEVFTNILAQTFTWQHRKSRFQKLTPQNTLLHKYSVFGVWTRQTNIMSTTLHIGKNATSQMYQTWKLTDFASILLTTPASLITLFVIGKCMSVTVPMIQKQIGRKFQPHDSLKAMNLRMHSFQWCQETQQLFDVLGRLCLEEIGGVWDKIRMSTEFDHLQRYDGWSSTDIRRIFTVWDRRALLEGLPFHGFDFWPNDDSLCECLHKGDESTSG